MASSRRIKQFVFAIPFGKKGGRYVTPAEVNNGLACDCVCPGCGMPLIACQGEKKRAYFRHEGGSGCSGGLESSIHCMGKQIIQDHGWVSMPSYDEKITAYDDNGRVIATKRVQAEKHRIDFDAVELEKQETSFKPDVTAHVGNQTFFIEIYFTHEVDEEKAEKVRALGLPMIEINLAEFVADKALTLSELELAVLEDAPRHWVHNPQLIELLDQASVWAHELEQDVRDLLEELSPVNIVIRNEELQKRSTTDPNLVPLLKPLLDSWLLNAKEEDWQMAIYQKYVRDGIIDQDIYVREIEHWLRNEFGFWPLIESWYSTETEPESQAVSHALKHRELHWPRLITLVFAYLEHLLSAGLLKEKTQPGTYRGVYQVKHRGLGQVAAAKAEKAAMAKILESQKRKKALLNSQLTGRPSRMPRENTPDQKVKTSIRLCVSCGSLMPDHKCKFCGCLKAVDK